MTSEAKNRGGAVGLLEIFLQAVTGIAVHREAVQCGLALFAKKGRGPETLRSIHPGCGAGLDQVSALTLGLCGASGFDLREEAVEIVRLVWDSSDGTLSGLIRSDPIITRLYPSELVEFGLSRLLAMRAQLRRKQPLLKIEQTISVKDFDVGWAQRFVPPADLMTASLFLYYRWYRDCSFLPDVVDEFSWLVKPGGVAVFGIADDADHGEGELGCPEKAELCFMPRATHAFAVLAEVLGVSYFEPYLAVPLISAEESRQDSCYFRHAEVKHSWAVSDCPMLEILRPTLLFQAGKWSEAAAADLVPVVKEALKRISLFPHGIWPDRPFTQRLHFYAYERNLAKDESVYLVPPI